MNEDKIREGKEYAEMLLHVIDEFREKIKEGTRDAENFVNITEIERLWSALRGNTSNIYLDMLQDLLSDADESGLIRKKKQNTEERG
ncbi:MAG: hypothetical protein LBS31_04905 [Candidatus Adiutrix sp.]|jgi:hypothetical protein|nr:hypothetical protein [Candidatus Adiutrix sp.]